MAKIYDHAVIYNGVLYPANTPIKEKKVASENETTERPKKSVEKAGAKDNDSTAD